MDERERDFADATTELADTLEALRTELRRPTGDSRGLPRPPRPTEILRFTERYTIPTVIALLEASIKALELLAAALRVADGRPIEAVANRSDRESGIDSLETLGREGGDRLARTSRKTLQRLDDALADLQSAAAAEPSNPEIKRLLEEARELRAEVDERLTAAVEGRDAAATTEAGERESVEIGIQAVGDASNEADESEDGDGIGIDVDEELASIKDEIDADRSSSTAPDEEGGDDAEAGKCDDTKTDGEQRSS